MKIIIYFLFIPGIFITADASAQQYKRGVLVEEFTSQQCPYSPRGDQYTDSVCALMPHNAVALLWHNGYIHDDFSIKAGDSLVQGFRVGGVPQMVVNRLYLSDVPQFQENDPLYADHIKKPAFSDPMLSIEIVNEVYDPLTGKVECDIDIQTPTGTLIISEDTAQYSVTAVITEDSIMTWQYHDFLGNNDTIMHNNIVRSVGGKVLGDGISFKLSPAIRIHYSFILSPDWNPANMKIKAFVSVKYPLIKTPFHYNVLNATQTIENINSYLSKITDKLVFLFPQAGDTLDPKQPAIISWNKLAGKEKDITALSYSIDGGSSWTNIATVSNTSSYTWYYPGEVQKKHIQLRITDLTNTGFVANSGVFYIMTRGFRAIQNVNVTGGPELAIATEYSITWNKVGDIADTVNIELSMDGQATWTTIVAGVPIALGSKGVSWLTPTQASSSAYIRIISRDAVAGYSGQLKIVDSRPQYINNIRIEGLPYVQGGSDALISWNVSGAIGETVEIAISANHDTGYSPIVSALPVGGGIYQYKWHVPDLSMPKAYIRIKSSYGIVGYSQLFSIVSSAGITEISGNKEVNLDQNYPNPFRSSTTIRFSLKKSEEISLMISDISGREVRRIRNNELEQEGIHEELIDVGNLPSGIYMITLFTRSQRLQRKMVVEK